MIPPDERCVLTVWWAYQEWCFADRGVVGGLRLLAVGARTSDAFGFS